MKGETKEEYENRMASARAEVYQVTAAQRRLQASYPHEGGCPDCRAEKVCNACGEPRSLFSGGCTNGRCAKCHAAVCVVKSPEIHGYGVVGPVVSHEKVRTTSAFHQGE